MPPDPPSKSTCGAQQDLGLNEHPYLTLTYAPATSATIAIKCLEARYILKCMKEYIPAWNRSDATIVRKRLYVLKIVKFTNECTLACHRTSVVTLCFFIRTSNFGAEAERSYIFFAIWGWKRS